VAAVHEVDTRRVTEGQGEVDVRDAGEKAVDLLGEGTVLAAGSQARLEVADGNLADSLQ
jgi:hypothetical protein